MLVGYLVFLITASSGFGLSQTQRTSFFSAFFLKIHNSRTGGSTYFKTLKGPVDFMEEPVKKGWVMKVVICRQLILRILVIYITTSSLIMWEPWLWTLRTALATSGCTKPLWVSIRVSMVLLCSYKESNTHFGSIIMIIENQIPGWPPTFRQAEHGLLFSVNWHTMILNFFWKSQITA